MSGAEAASPAPARGGKLNSFQRTMLLWEEVGPYNGAHALRLEGPAALPALGESIRAACREAGLGDLVLDRGRGLFHYDPPAEPITLREVDRAGRPARAALVAAAGEEMDRAFPRGPHHPIRWLVLDDREGGGHYLALVYHHVAADATSLRLLLRNVLGRYFDTGAAPVPIEVAPAAAAPARSAPWKSARALARSARLYFRLRRAYRLPLRRGAGTSSRFLVRDAPPGLLDRLAAAARSRGGTVNDAFLAALAASVAERTPRRRGRRRSALAIALAADLRGEGAAEMSSAFGVHLAQSVVVIADPDAGAAGDLLAPIAALTRRAKAAGDLAGPQWTLAFLSRLARRFSSWNSRGWYRKVYPLAAGLTNVRWKPEWFGPGGRRIVEYFRLPPPGPALPLVLAPTTFGDQLTIAMGWSESALDEAEAERLAALFLAQLDQCCGT